MPMYVVVAFVFSSFCITFSCPATCPCHRQHWFRLNAFLVGGKSLKNVWWFVFSRHASSGWLVESLFWWRLCQTGCCSSVTYPNITIYMTADNIRLWAVRPLKRTREGHNYDQNMNRKDFFDYINYVNISVDLILEYCIIFLSNTQVAVFSY